MSVARDIYSMNMSPPPPADLGTYSRSMHQHTKRQMEAASLSSTGSSSSATRRTQSQNSRQMSAQQSGATSAVPNGVASRGRNPNEYNYRT